MPTTAPHNRPTPLIRRSRLRNLWAAMCPAAKWILVAVLLLSQALFICGIGDFAGDKDAFPGWLGNGRRVTQEPKGKPAAAIDRSRIVELSAWKPRAFLYKGFLSDAECDHIKGKAAPRLSRSAVVNNENGASVVSEVRTSSGMFLGKGEDAIIRGIEERIAEWTQLPIPNQEPLQVLRYEKGQKYLPHFDYFHDPVNKQRGGHRFATVLMYLNNVTKGGETVFPTAKDPTPKDDTWSDCAKGYLAVKPRAGDALLFFDMLPEGTPDGASLHYACPVLEGEKWSAPMWIHVADFHRMFRSDAAATREATMAKSTDGDGCADTNLLCRSWAFNGNCGKDSKYMNEACRKSCGTCAA